MPMFRNRVLRECSLGKAYSSTWTGRHRTEEPHWTTSRLQRLPHNKSAGKQVHHLRFLDPERKAPKGAHDTSRERDERLRHADRWGEASCLG